MTFSELTNWTVYRLFTEEGEYFGITQNLPNRLKLHRIGKRNGQDHPYYGFEILKTDLSYEDACQIEDLLITSLPCINRKRSGLIRSNGNKRTYWNNWRADHRDEVNARLKITNKRRSEGEIMMWGKTHMVTARKILNGELL